jgi:large subunit ribosomal protein L25
MKTIAVKGELRTDLGKVANKTIRREGKVPAVLYGGDTVTHFATTSKDVRDLVYTGEFRIAEVEVDGKKEKAILKDVQFHPVTEEILHIDFLRLIDGHPVKVYVPLRFKGNAIGVRNGGKLIQTLRRVHIKTLPENMVSELLADVSQLKMGQSLRVRDIEVDENTEILMSPSVPIVSVEIPRALRSAASAAAKEAKAGGGGTAEAAEE